MFISRDELSERLSDSRNLSQNRHSLIISRGDKNLPKRTVPTNLHLPTQIKKIIGCAAQTSNPATVAAAFGVSTSEVRALDKGQRGNDEVQDAIDEHRKNIALAAAKKVKSSLTYLDDSKLATCRPVEIAGIAVSLSRVMEIMQGKRDGNNDNRVQIVIHAPEQKKIEDYEVITVTSQKEDAGPNA